MTLHAGADHSSLVSRGRQRTPQRIERVDSLSREVSFTRYWTVARDVDPETVLEAGRKMGDVVRLSGVSLAGPDGTGEPMIDANTGEVAFNGVEGADYETFRWPPDLVAGQASPGDQNSVFDFCKTGLLPYDAVVAACLEAAQEVLGESMTVDADRAIDG